MRHSFYNEELMLSHFGGEREILYETIQHFLVAHKRTLFEIHHFAQQNNMHETYICTHKLRGMVSVFFSEELSSSLKVAEDLAKRGKRLEFEARLELVKLKLAILTTELERFLEGAKAC